MKIKNPAPHTIFKLSTRSLPRISSPFLSSFNNRCPNIKSTGNTTIDRAIPKMIHIKAFVPLAIEISSKIKKMIAPRIIAPKIRFCVSFVSLMARAYHYILNCQVSVNIFHRSSIIPCYNFRQAAGFS